MNLISLRISFPAAARAFFALAVLFSLSLRAQTAATGTIEGRVYDAGRSGYLEKARLTIEGTGLQAFTDESGQYRFTNVPAGNATVKVFFTGLAPQTEVVPVTAGQTVQRDITLAAATGSRAPLKNAAPGETVKLDQFVVSTSKEMDGAAIAINEQRFARNIMTVVAADEFGTVVDGTPGEILKFLPGITMDYSAGEARTISINGVPSSNVPITVGGFDLASAASGGTSRVTNLDQFSVNNIARIEKNDSPTPESTGSALAGSVNMVPRSAFERSRPSYNASGFMMMKDGDRHFNKTAGPLNKPMRKVTEGGNFSAVVPVNKRFGFTLSGNAIPHQYSYEDVAISTWRGAGSATNVAANATTGLPDTTPDKPYLTDFVVRDSTRDNPTYSVGATLDFKVARTDTLSLGFQWTWIGVLHNPRTLSFFVNRVLPGEWGPTFTKAAPGAFGEVRIQSGAQDWFGTTSTPTLRWRHEGSIWKSEAGLGYSRASLHIRNVDKGFFGAAQARRTGVNVSFADIFYLRPNTITVTDATGAPVDPYNLANYSLANADDHPNDTRDLKRSVYANTKRDFFIRDVPFTLKGGVDMKVAERDRTGGTKTYTYVGPDKRGSTTPVGNDDSAGGVVDEAFSQRFGPYGFPRIQWIDNHEYYGLYKEHPDYFTIDENAFYRSQVDRNTNAREIISSAYLSGDVAFFQRRLRFVGGVRAEQTNVKGEGRLNDPTLDFQRDASGRVIDSNPNQAGVQPALIVPTNAGLAYSKLTYLSRGQHTKKEYLRMFPSLNASYNVRENLTLRGAYYWSVGRPDFNQYVGGLTLPDTEQLASPTNRITVNNPGIKAWSARSYKLRLEYYFQRVGQISIGGFRRDFKNFFGSTVFNATPEFLALNNLDPSIYDPYDVSTNYNLQSTVRMTGLEFDYKQALTFLPEWARGVQVFANASAQRATGEGAANFAGYVPRYGSWGVSFTRSKYLFKANWNYRGMQRRGIIAAGRSIEANTYNWGSKRLYVDLTGEYKFLKSYTLFANMRNIGDQTEDSKIFGPSTPDYARFRQRVDYGSAWTFGVRGSW